MAFSWKFFNDADQEKVDSLNQRTLNIKKNHDKLRSIKSVDLAAGEEQALEDLIKRYQKKLDSAIDVITDFDQELETFTKAIEERLNQ